MLPVQKSEKSESVSTSTLLISDSHRCHSAPKLTKQLSLSLGPSVKQTKKSLKYLKTPHLFPLFNYSRDKLVYSDLSLNNNNNNSKLKCLTVPNPNYFINVRDRKESSSSNHTDNEDSNNEEVSLRNIQMDKMKKFKSRFKEKKYLSQDFGGSSEDSRDVDEAGNSDDFNSFSEKFNYKEKNKKRKSLSLWCLQRANDNYKIVDAFGEDSRETEKISESSDVAESPDDVFLNKPMKKVVRARRGSRLFLKNYLDDNNSDSDVYLNKKKKYNAGLLTRFKSENSHLLRNGRNVTSQEIVDKSALWRQSTAETATMLAFNSRKLPRSFEIYGKNLSKKLLMNLKFNLFGNSGRSEKREMIIGQRPIVFGGTFPIDMPLGGDTRNRIVIEKDVTDKVIPMSEVRTYEIDVPLSDGETKSEITFSNNRFPPKANNFGI